MNVDILYYILICYRILLMYYIRYYLADNALGTSHLSDHSWPNEVHKILPIRSGSRDDYRK